MRKLGAVSAVVTLHSIKPRKLRLHFSSLFSYLDKGGVNMARADVNGMGYSICNLLLSIARFPEGDPAIRQGQVREGSMEISTRDITKVRD